MRITLGNTIGYDLFVGPFEQLASDVKSGWAWLTGTEYEGLPQPPSIPSAILGSQISTPVLEAGGAGIPGSSGSNPLGLDTALTQSNIAALEAFQQGVQSGAAMGASDTEVSAPLSVNWKTVAIVAAIGIGAVVLLRRS